jgi:DNA-directed RNA polymerase subunit N (RpoN/RPB10)
MITKNLKKIICIISKMIIPVRCMTCNMVIGSKYQQYLTLLSDAGIDPSDAQEIIQLREDSEPEKQTKVQEVFDQLGLKRYCCRRHMLAHVDLIDDI